MCTAGSPPLPPRGCACDRDWHRGVPCSEVLERDDVHDHPPVASAGRARIPPLVRFTIFLIARATAKVIRTTQ
eukprot:5136849-Pleurochrysis_carterae.AAC.1